MDEHDSQQLEVTQRDTPATALAECWRRVLQLPPAVRAANKVAIFHAANASALAKLLDELETGVVRG